MLSFGSFKVKVESSLVQYYNNCNIKFSSDTFTENIIYNYYDDYYDESAVYSMDTFININFMSIVESVNLYLLTKI